MLDRILDNVFGNGVESDAARLILGNTEFVRQMPGNGFAFAVRVCCEKDFIGILRFFFERADDIAFAADIDIMRRKVILDINAERAFGQVADMAV